MKAGKQEKEMDWEPVFALPLYCVTDPDQENKFLRSYFPDGVSL
jgi:hypothetical protein